MAQTRTVDVRKLFSYSLGPIPWSLANTDGTPAKACKAKLLHLIESKTAPADSVPVNAVWLADGMALLQALQGLPHYSTFADVAFLIFERVTSPFKSGS